MDRVETNFRLVLLGQRETNLKVNTVATRLSTVATQMGAVANQVSAIAVQMGEMATLLTEVAQKGEETAERLEDSLGVMKTFADGQAEIRATLADCVRRIEVLEEKKAS